ncbi:Calpain-2 catalytic subunit [Armadillidium vulgare]|nr:Calpain-2 catalytic subunit [Armadillidium vulgare]
MQEHRQSVKNEAVKMHQIGFCVYKTDNPNAKIPLSKFYMTYDIGNSGTYINYREVLCRLELSPGYYVIIPATFEPDMSGSFMVRVYSPNEFELKSLD